MSWIKYGVLGAIGVAGLLVGAALLSDDSEEKNSDSGCCSFDDLERNLKTSLKMNRKHM